MLMVELKADEGFFLPVPDGREVHVDYPRESLPANSVTITIPALKATDQVILTVGGRRMSILGDRNPKKRGGNKTRLALSLPDDCRVRYIHRERKPRKGT